MGVASPAASIALIPYEVFAKELTIVGSNYGVFAAPVRTQVISRPKVMLWLRRTFAATYVLLAGRLAAESQ
jgi:threonine/homoserine/homoserine lactone efflux protein